MHPAWLCGAAAMQDAGCDGNPPTVAGLQVPHSVWRNSVWTCVLKTRVGSGRSCTQGGQTLLRVVNLWPDPTLIRFALLDLALYRVYRTCYATWQLQMLGTRWSYRLVSCWDVFVVLVCVPVARIAQLLELPVARIALDVPLGPHAADARQGMLARRRSGRLCLAEEAKLVCAWTLCPTWRASWRGGTKATSGPDSLEIELENLMDDHFKRRERGCGARSQVGAECKWHLVRMLCPFPPASACGAQWQVDFRYILQNPQSPHWKVWPE